MERGSFTPLVFSTLGGCGREADRATKMLAERISTKQNENYAKTLTIIRTEISFAIIKAATLCLRGARSKYSVPANTIDVSLDMANAQVK